MKKIIVGKKFQIANYFDVNLQLIKLLFHSETIKEPVSIPMSIKDGN